MMPGRGGRQVRINPYFLKGSQGNLFIVEIAPRREPRATILFVPPFAEEMNRSRFMVGKQARKLAALGYRVLIPDLFGTGDSAGDFGDARWNDWVDDVGTILGRARGGADGPVWVWGLRMGALLALDTLSRESVPAAGILLWNACIDGESFIGQFLRMRTMASMLARADATESIADLKGRLRDGETLEVAGYSLSPELFESMCSRSIETLLADRREQVYWLDVAPRADSKLPIRTAALLERLTEAGARIDAACVEGPAFWQTPEISTSEPLLERTAELFEQK